MKSRVPEIVKYIVDNEDSYLFSSITAAYDTVVKFNPVEDGADIGYLQMDLEDAKFLINDGQHRCAAISHLHPSTAPSPSSPLDGDAGDIIGLLLFLSEGVDDGEQPRNEFGHVALSAPQQRFEEERFAELLLREINGFSDAIGEQDEAISRVELDFGGRGGQVIIEGEWQAGGDKSAEFARREDMDPAHYGRNCNIRARRCVNPARHRRPWRTLTPRCRGTKGCSLARSPRPRRPPRGRRRAKPSPPPP